MDYYQGYEDAMRQARVTRSTGLIGILFRTIVSISYSAFVYVPLLIFSYYIAGKLSSLYSNDLFIKIALTIIVAYLLFSFVYFLKGILIGMRNNGRILWVAIWSLCVILTCGIQAVFGQILLEDFFQARHIANYQVWSWIGACAIVILIYSHYQFLTNMAPRSVFWSYQIGFAIVQATSRKDIKLNIAPKKSVSYFENAPMKVSYKKE